MLTVYHGDPVAAYIAYQRYHLEPRYAKNPDLAPEVRFELAIVAGLTIPIALLMFGWGARTNVHWVSNTLPR